MNFAFLFLLTASRMRSCACDTASRLWVRTVLCSSAFLLVPPLPSTGSAADRPALFAGFAGNIGESDFPVPFIIGYDRSLSDAALKSDPQGGDRDLPVPAQKTYTRSKVSDGAGLARRSRCRAAPYCLLLL